MKIFETENIGLYLRNPFNDGFPFFLNEVQYYNGWHRAVMIGPFHFCLINLKNYEE